MDVVDFDDGIPAEIQEKIMKTAEYRRYLSARKRVAVLAKARMEAGLPLCDSKILAAAAEVEAIGEEMKQEVGRIKRETR